MPRLGDIASIHTGLTLRDRPVGLPGSSLRLLQLGDIDLNGSIAFSTLVSVVPGAYSERYVAKEGDLVFRPRGAGIAAGVIPEHQGKVLVVSPLILIRPDRTRVDPIYLAWAIRSPRAHQHFALHARGSSVIGVGKKDLETLEVELPNLEAQKKIAAIVELQQVEDDLLERLRRARRQLVDALLSDEVSSVKSKLPMKGQST